MPDVAEQPAKPPRTWRPMAAWTAAILLALGLAWFIGAVVVPYWQVRRAVASRLERNEVGYEDGPDYRKHGAEIVESLGGAAAAARKTRGYMIRSGLPAPHREEAVWILGFCGKEAYTDVLNLLEDQDPLVRESAGRALYDMFEFEDGSWQKPLLASLRANDPTERRRAAEGLGAIAGICSPIDHQVMAALRAALKDSDASVCAAAAEALKKIRGEEAPK